MGSTTKESLDAAVLKAELDLNVAVMAMTGSLQYQWEGEWREEIEALNQAHTRWLDAKLNQRKAQ